MNKFFINIVRYLFDFIGPLIGPPNHNVQIKTILIDEGVKLTIFTPSNLAKKNIILYFHGGGWIVGSIRAYERILKYICFKTEFLVIGVDYRKAPEYKYPQSSNDAIAAYIWVIKNIVKDDKIKISIIGDSAGGSLVAGLMKWIKQQNLISPNLAILIYPAIGIDRQSMDYLKYSKPRWLNLPGYYAIKYFFSQYLKDSNDLESLNNIQLLPSSFKDNTDTKILILMAQWDPLTKLILNWKEKQIHSSENIECIIYPKTIHGFINFTRFSRQAKIALDKIIDSLLL